MGDKLVFAFVFASFAFDEAVDSLVSGLNLKRGRGAYVFSMACFVGSTCCPGLYIEI